MRIHRYERLLTSLLEDCALQSGKDLDPSKAKHAVNNLLMYYEQPDAKQEYDKTKKKSLR